MRITENGYHLLEEKLEEMEQAIIEGFNKGTEPKACLDIKCLVHEARQIMNNNFYVDDKNPSA